MIDTPAAEFHPVAFGHFRPVSRTRFGPGIPGWIIAENNVKVDLDAYAIVDRNLLEKSPKNVIDENKGRINIG